MRINTSDCRETWWRESYSELWFVLPALWFLLGIGCAKPGLIVMPEHVKGCSIPMYSLAAGEQKVHSVICGEEEAADPIRHWIETYDELGYRLLAVTAVDDACLGDIFRVLFRRGAIYLEIRGGPNLIQHLAEGTRFYGMRIQRSRFADKPEPWQGKLSMGSLYSIYSAASRSDAVSMCGPNVLKLDSED